MDTTLDRTLYIISPLFQNVFRAVGHSVPEPFVYDYIVAKPKRIIMKDVIDIGALKKNSMARSVDTRGTRSPETLLEVIKVLDSMNEGEILEVLSADTKTKNDIPAWCVKQGHGFLGALYEDGFFRLYIEKKQC